MRFFLLLALLSYTISGNAQYDFDRNDFFEIGYAYNSILKSDYLQYSTYSDLSSDQEFTSDVSKGHNFQANLRYGKAITPFAHIVLGIGYDSRNEVLSGDLVYLEEIIGNEEVVRIQAIGYSFGIRLKCFQTEKIDFSIGGGGQAIHTVRAPDDLIAAYYGRAVLGFNFNERIQLNAKYGYQSTAGKYLYASMPAELAFHFKIY